MAKPANSLPQASLTGGRSRSSIMRVIRQNISTLKYKAKSESVLGDISISMSINEFDKVISVYAKSSTLNKSNFKQFIIKDIRNWKFGKISKSNDITEVVYPFSFN